MSWRVSRRFRWLLACLAVYAGLSLLLMRYREVLLWSAGALHRLTIESKLPGRGAEKQLFREVKQNLRNGQSYAEQEELLVRVSLLDPNHVEALNMLAEVWQRQGRGEEARRLWERAIRVDPLSGHADRALAAWHRQQGRHEAAITILETGLARLQRWETQYRPLPDRSVPRSANRKAARLHRELREEVDKLRRELDGLTPSASG
ncbi:MAG: tetratricopeptide repeat protein [Magnetococcales bacterium]|nr:tetratricopeptide repeat protein [Magnetococcales bacterium]